MIPALLSPAVFGRYKRLTALIIFIASLALYVLTAEPTASYWDCPEYVTTAARLEPGHPPGNPFWTLTARIFTLFAPAPQYQALTVNIMSALCSAIAATLLFLTLVMLLSRLFGIERDPCIPRTRAGSILAGSAVGAIVLAVSDTFWFSAIEAEVYAFSVMLTALTFWLTLLWAERRREPGSIRYLILVAYITGLSIGVHQLNLLCLPALALIVVFAVRANLRPLTLTVAMVASLLAIAAILYGMMPASLELAARCELIAVNDCGLPLNSGVALYALLTLLLLVVAALLWSSKAPAWLAVLLSIAAIWLSGLPSFGGFPLVGGIFVGLAAICLLAMRLMRRRVNRLLCAASLWGAAFLFLGFCSYGIILIRGAANPPMNQGAPSDIFALTAYIQRDQYGEAPLVYGHTPQSKFLYEEVITTDTLTGERHVSYPRYYGEPVEPAYFPVDSAGRLRYLPLPRQPKYRYAPELNMWFPRIYSTAPADSDSYRGWCGMTRETMVPVEVSFAVDSTGKAVGRLDILTGERTRETAYRPTYLQNFSMLAGYQMSYMYMRYLMWNFVGRQNEVYAQGEPDAGNFITGFYPLDDMMTGNSRLLPPDIGADNEGHHVYFLLPLILGVAGIACQYSRGKRGRRQLAVTALLFILTGVAIVIYLNQTPGQPRERDYSFVGSFYAFAIWIGTGAAALLLWAFRRLRAPKIWQKILPLFAIALVAATPIIMLAENYPDHDRSRRTLTPDAAYNALAALPKDAMLFVNGDNFIFPLWYLQETEGVRTDVRIVNLSYLSTPWYIMQLRLPSSGATPPRLSIPEKFMNPRDLNRFAAVNIGYGTRDAAEALAELFAVLPPDGTRPKINADSLRLAIPGSQADSITVSLRDIASGSSFIRLNRLIMLDLIASNPERGIFWSTALPKADRLTLDRESFGHGLTLRYGAPADRDTLGEAYNLITGTFRFGNLDAKKRMYVDQPGRQQVMLLRRYIARTAAGLLDRNAPGDALRARQVADLSRAKLPPSAVPYSAILEEQTLHAEALDLAEIYLRISEITGDATARQTALQMSREEALRAAAYTRYLTSLTSRYRNYTKSRTRLNREALTYAMELYVRAGGDTALLRRHEAMKGIDWPAEERHATDSRAARLKK